ncbi:hypothetical protein C1H46_038606 [Malus baccata]|uniref:Uncharacterized protein n=1 Tax=Malus baccata TaxID=106549 RepID=A0A540KNR7_MALBA|nr:hypothetical protein C1H46_038606 [Malus baccata]
MDLLCNAYCNASDNEEAEAEGIKETFTPPNPKRLKPDNPFAHTKFHHPLPESTQFPTTQAEAPVPGRYISKRERALLATQPTVPEPNPNPNPNAPVTTLPVFGSISDSDVRRDVMSLLRNKGKKGQSQLGQLPQRMSVALNRHTKAVNAVHWSPTHAHLLASASMDHTICIWNVWSSDQKVARVLNFHSAAVKDVKWSQQGLSVLSCGYDSSSRLVDVEKGLEIQVFKEDQVVSVIKFHPDNSNLFISGGSKGGIRLWDVRSGKVVHEYIRGHDPILDLEFSTNSKQIISSSDVSGRNLSENSIVVWDVSRQVPLSNQVRDLFQSCFNMCCKCGVQSVYQNMVAPAYPDCILS